MHPGRLQKALRGSLWLWGVVVVIAGAWDCLKVRVVIEATMGGVADIGPVDVLGG